MFILEIEHIDQEGPDGQTQSHDLATFDSFWEAEKVAKKLTLEFPNKSFFVYRKIGLPHNPLSETLANYLSWAGLSDDAPLSPEAEAQLEAMKKDEKGKRHVGKEVPRMEWEPADAVSPKENLATKETK
jgi:hypothetical protein